LGEPLNWPLVKELRSCVFSHFAQSNESGMIYTGVWAFDLREDHEYYNSIFALWRELCPNVEICIIELQADLDERLRRNSTENRLHHKPSKRDLAWSEADLRTCHERYRLHSELGEITESNYLRIDNTHLSADDVAAQICTHFNFALEV